MRSTDSAILSLRVKALSALYQHIAATRMQGIPLLNLAVQVEAVGFELVQADASDAEAPAAGAGVLVTPWFMNLVWLPLRPLDLSRQVGCKVPRYVGCECFEFIGAHEDGFGSYEACSLFSPVFEFENHKSAVVTAKTVLEMLRQPASTAAAQAAKPAHSALPQVPARRAFLFGRSSTVPSRGEAGHG